MPTPDALEALLSLPDRRPSSAISASLRAASHAAQARAYGLQAAADEFDPYLTAEKRAESAAFHRGLAATFRDLAERAQSTARSAQATEALAGEHPDCAGCAYEGEARS